MVVPETEIQEEETADIFPGLKAELNYKKKKGI